MRPVPASRPPDKEVFVEATDVERLTMLTGAWIEQTGRLAECNGHLDALADWKAEVLRNQPHATILTKPLPPGP